MASALKLNEALAVSLKKGEITEKIAALLSEFYKSYNASLIAHHIDPAPFATYFLTYLDLIKLQLKTPFVFQPFHRRVLHPFDYYKFGIEFMRPLVDEKLSHVHGKKNLQEVENHLKKGSNVVFLANHQIEADPQAISILLDPLFPTIAPEMIFVAGERVITDPLAVPFSMGRSLLCIYSKRYIDNPPEKKAAKQAHNKKTMQLMSHLLKEGGKCIYVAPSGGRDRPGADGKIEPAPFDAQSIEMFYLMAQKAKTPTYFYPMALSTYDLLPPPETIQVELGEVRTTQRGAIHLAVGPVIDMEHFPGCEDPDKHERRQRRAHFIWNQVYKDYTTIA
ncbi:MAG: 1-acyl-sn-glycerol-3-phosphate acyltransferase [Verrucomicrobia bacterium]|nr:1-acyl-sn-glycerol-3-phosphate acyltransferase [Verrucomicrobiota bacterium]